MSTSSAIESLAAARYEQARRVFAESATWEDLDPATKIAWCDLAWCELMEDT